MTPAGSTLFFDNTDDGISGGQFESGSSVDSSTREGSRHQVENIYFPTDRIPLNGIYTYYVELIEQAGITLDKWNLTVYANESDDTIIQGFGSSPRYTYSSVSDLCAIAYEIGSECCGNEDCLSSAICVGRQCVPSSAPRFSISWFGGKTNQWMFLTFSCGRFRSHYVYLYRR